MAMARARRLAIAFRFAFLAGIAVATACGDEPEDGDGDDDGDAGNAGEPSTGGRTSGGSGGATTGGTSTGGEAGDGTTGGRGGTSSATGGDSGEGGDAGDGGQGADSGEGGSAGSSAGMSGGGMGGANGGMAGGGMAGGGMAGGGMAGGGMAGGGMAGGGMAGGGMAGGGMAGAAGAGGSGAVFCATAAILDDMEDGNGAICASANRVGGWYVNKQTGVGTIIPDVGTVVSPSLLVPSRSPSTRGMHFQGSGFAGADHWAYIATSVFNGTENVPYDASVHTGIRFWARSDAGSVTLNVKFNTVATSGTSFGTCVPTSTLPCDDHWQVPRVITAAWTQFSVYFPSDLSQLGWGVVCPKDLAHLRAIEFYYSSNGNSASFDFWIDDIEFW
jgi:hypothetical protein